MDKISSIEKLETFSSKECSLILMNEHPQTIALILAFLKEEKSIEIINFFSTRLSTDVLLRLSTMDEVNSFWLEKLNIGLEKTLEGRKDYRNISVNSFLRAKKIFNNFLINKNEDVTEGIKEYDPDLYQTMLENE